MAFAEKISVIVCTYNQEHTIQRTLESILSQQCSWPIEIIIGEDSSTDNTRSICQQYAQQYPSQIRLFANAHNKGLLNNYFDCLLQAKGKYIAELAGDDEWCDPLKLEKQKDILEQHPDIVLVHTDYQLRKSVPDQEKEIICSSPDNPYPQEAFIDGKLLTQFILTQTNRPVVHLCTAMYRNEVFRTIYTQQTDMLRNPLYPCEDLPMTAFFSRFGKFAYLNQITLNYSVSTTLSNTNDECRQFEFVKRCTQLSYDLMLRIGLPRDAKFESYFSYRVFALLMHAFRTHRKDLRTETRKCASRWNAHLELRTLFVALLTSNDTLWSLSLFFRKQLLKLFRH